MLSDRVDVAAEAVEADEVIADVLKLRHELSPAVPRVPVGQVAAYRSHFRSEIHIFGW